MTEKGTSQWHEVFMKEFEKESDRACVILSAAMLEIQLEIILKSTLVAISSSNDSLFERAYSPISTLSAKVDLAHRLGLISTKFCRDLHIIRKIRNDFAHNITGCSFNNTIVLRRITELTKSSGMAERNPKLRKAFPVGARGDFKMTVSWMLWYLCQLSDLVTAINPAKIEWGYTHKYNREQ